MGKWLLVGKWFLMGRLLLVVLVRVERLKMGSGMYVLWLMLLSLLGFKRRLRGRCWRIRSTGDGWGWFVACRIILFRIVLAPFEIFDDWGFCWRYCRYWLRRRISMTWGIRGQRPQYGRQIRCLTDLSVHRELKSKYSENGCQPEDAKLQQRKKCAGEVKEGEADKEEWALISECKC